MLNILPEMFRVLLHITLFMWSLSGVRSEGWYNAVGQPVCMLEGIDKRSDKVTVNRRAIDHDCLQCSITNKKQRRREINLVCCNSVQVASKVDDQLKTSAGVAGIAEAAELTGVTGVAGLGNNWKGHFDPLANLIWI